MNDFQSSQLPPAGNMGSYPHQQRSPKQSRYRRLLVLILLLVIGYGLYYAFSKVTAIVINNGGSHTAENGAHKLPTLEELNPIPKADTDHLNILILANSVGRTDGSTEDTGALLTDSIELLVINKTTKQASLTSIPRDLQVQMFGVDGKINEAYVRGMERNKAIAYVSELISRITGVHVDKTVVVDLNAFKDIVDSIGGVDVYLDKPFLESTQWTYPFSLPAGDNHLDGQQALYYARSRFSSSDFDRARRQQQLMTAIKSKVFSLGLFTDPLKAIALFNTVKANIKTDFQLWDIKDVVSLANAFGASSKIKSYQITTDNLLNEGHTAKGEYILTPKSGDFKGMQAFFNAIFTGKDPNATLPTPSASASKPTASPIKSATGTTPTKSTKSSPSATPKNLLHQ